MPDAQRNIERGRHRLQRDAGAGDQRLQQHVARAQLEPGAAGRRMQAGGGERAAGLDLAGDIGVVERALRLQGDDRGVRIVLVALLDRRLQRAQFIGVHRAMSSSIRSRRRRQHHAADDLAGAQLVQRGIDLVERPRGHRTPAAGPCGAPAPSAPAISAQAADVGALDGQRAHRDRRQRHREVAADRGRR